jgi:hypothetical protein
MILGCMFHHPCAKGIIGKEEGVEEEDLASSKDNSLMKLVNSMERTT